MKKLLFVFLMFVSVSGFSQTKQEEPSDSALVRIEISYSQFKNALITIDNTVDSRKAHQFLLQLFQTNAKIVSDKPKELIKK